MAQWGIALGVALLLVAAAVVFGRRRVPDRADVL